MPAASQGIRRIFSFYARLCLLAGLAVLAVLLGLRLTNGLLDWSAPFDPADWLIFGAGLIVVLALLGPYVATTGQLAGVRRIRASVRNETPASPARQKLTLAIVAAPGLVLAGLLVLSRSLIVWLSFGLLPVVMSLLLYYIAWRIGRLERQAGITIYQTDYNWRFDRESYIGVYQK